MEAKLLVFSVEDRAFTTKRGVQVSERVLQCVEAGEPCLRHAVRVACRDGLANGISAGEQIIVGFRQIRSFGGLIELADVVSLRRLES